MSLDGIIQEPDFSFNVSLSSGSPKITFASAPSNGSRIFIVFLGRSTVSMVSAQLHIDEFNGDGSTTAFTLTQVPSASNASNFIVFVDNVYQRYGSSYAFTVNGATLTFTSAPPSGTNNIQVIQQLTNITKYCCR